MDCFGEPVIGRAFARPVGSQRGVTMIRPGQIRSAHLTIFWHCGFGHFSSRMALERGLGNKPSTVLAEDAVPKGLAMLIRSCLYEVQGGAANAVRTPATSAASLPTLLIGGLLLICP